LDNEIVRFLRGFWYAPTTRIATDPLWRLLSKMIVGIGLPQHDHPDESNYAADLLIHARLELK